MSAAPRHFLELADRAAQPMADPVVALRLGGGGKLRIMAERLRLLTAAETALKALHQVGDALISLVLFAALGQPGLESFQRSLGLGLLRLRLRLGGEAMVKLGLRRE